MPTTQYHFCEAPDCDVVHFAANAQTPLVRRSDLLVRVGAEEDADPIPVCYCFGFTRKDIENEIAEPGRSTVADQIAAEVKAGNCVCEVKNPSGKLCANVLSLYCDTLPECHIGAIDGQIRRSI